MLGKILIGIVGFLLGLFMLINSIVCIYRFQHGYRTLDPYEWLISSVVTFLVGIVLIIWTLLLTKRRR